MDKLKKIFKLQEELRKEIGDGKDLLSSLTKEERGRWITQYLACISSELEEVRNCIYWRHWCREWKGGKQFQIRNMQDIQEELVDVLHFYLDLCYLCDLDSDSLCRLYEQKQQVNIERQRSKYSQDKK